MIILTKKPDPNNSFDRSTVIVKSDGVALETVLEDVKAFLNAAGFYIEGELVDYVEEPQTKTLSELRAERRTLSREIRLRQAEDGVTSTSGFRRSCKSARSRGGKVR